MPKASKKLKRKNPRVTGDKILNPIYKRRAITLRFFLSGMYIYNLKYIIYNILRIIGQKNLSGLYFSFNFPYLILTVMKTKISFLFLLSYIFYLGSAQVPQGFNYQAIARDGTGNILPNTPLQVMLYIQSSSTGGTIFWKELHNTVTTNSFGLFTIVLGTGARQSGTVATFDKIDWTVTPKYVKTEIYYSGSWKDMGNAAQLWTVPYAMTAKSLGAGKLNIKGTATNPDSALFEVKNKDGQTIFAVYSEGVRVYVSDGNKGKRGGFAVGGFGTDKATSQQYLYVTDTCTRIYVKNAGKGQRGGFAVGGFDNTKADLGNYLNLTPQNYFIGHRSGLSTSGLYNTFFGFESGLNNTSGTANIFIGYRAGYSNSTGSDNLFFGNEAGLSNTTASMNVFLGPSAGYNNSIGSFNVFIGQNAGEANTTGSFNLFAGRNAGGFNTKGQLNTFLGINAGNVNTTGNENVNLGGESGKWNSTGSYNVNLGTGAGFYNTDGNYNINIGHYAGISLTSGSGNIFIGPGAGGGLANTSNKLFIENSYADASNALIYGEFDNNKLRFNANVGVNADPGTIRLYSYDDKVTNDDPAILGQHNTTAYYGVGVKGIGGYMGVYGESILVGSGARFGIYGNASGGESNFGVYGYAAGTNAYAGYFGGNVYVSGTVTQSSDRSLKKNIMPLSGSLQKILDLQGVTFEWKSETELGKSDRGENASSKPTELKLFSFPVGKQIGVIAQDVEKVVPELVQTNAEGLKSVDYIKMIPLLIEAMKEQQNLIDSQSEKILNLEKQLENLTREK
jgi:hypothetical protein